MSSTKNVSFTRLKVNHPDDGLGQKFKLAHGEGFCWHAEDGNPEITLIFEPDGSPLLTIQYLGENHRKPSAPDVEREIKKCLKIFQSTRYHRK